MTAFARRAAAVMHVPVEQLQRLAGGDLSEVLLLRRSEGQGIVAKGGPEVGIEATMLRTLAGLGIPAPAVEGEFDGVLLLDYVENDRVFSAKAWADIGAALRRLHDNQGESYGWPVDYSLGTVGLDNRQGHDWPRFWGEQRLAATAALLDRPWRDRVGKLERVLADLLPAEPRASLLHGDIWSGNILVFRGSLAALIDPACYYGHSEVDLAMLTLFDTPPPEFWESYGGLAAGWEERRHAYQLFPALVHLRLFGQSYAGVVDRLLGHLGV